MGYDPDWEAAKAQGVALVKQGYSLQAAQDATGVHNSTLCRALQRLEAGKADAATLFAADQALMASTLNLAAEAQKLQLQRMLDKGQPLETRDLNGIAAMSLRAYGTWRRWQAPQNDTGEPGSSSKLLDRLEQILASGNTLSLTVSPRPPDTDAIDVQAREITDDRGDSGSGEGQIG